MTRGENVHLCLIGTCRPMVKRSGSGLISVELEVVRERLLPMNYRNIRRGELDAVSRGYGRGDHDNCFAVRIRRDTAWTGFNSHGVTGTDQAV